MESKIKNCCSKLEKFALNREELRNVISGTNGTKTTLKMVTVDETNCTCNQYSNGGGAFIHFFPGCNVGETYYIIETVN
jgi:hypothetical protein